MLQAQCPSHLPPSTHAPGPSTNPAPPTPPNSATAGLGVIHRGQLQQGQALMGPYLPRAGGAPSGGSAYSQGGALYALGLIYANHGHDVRAFLLDSLRNTGDEVIQHGACLGLGEGLG